MAGFSDAAETDVLNWYFRGQAVTPPSVLWVGLATNEPNDDGTFTEVSYTGYQRQQVTSAQWNVPSGTDPTQVTNSQAITFPTCNEVYGETATHYVLMTDQATGSLRFSGQVTQPPGGLTINNGDQPQLDAAALRNGLGG